MSGNEATDGLNGTAGGLGMGLLEVWKWTNNSLGMGLLLVWDMGIGLLLVWECNHN